MIKLAIIEDTPLIGETLQNYFSSEEGFEVIFWAESAEEIPVEKIDQLDIVICDIGLPGKTGVETTWLLKQKKPNIQIIIFTVFEDKERIFQALQAGASGYLLKNTSLPKIKKYLREVQAGGAAISPGVAQKIITYFQTPKKTATPLSERESEILKYTQLGHTKKQIAERLDISVDTVKFHVKKIYTKLQIKSRTELLAYFNPTK